MRTTRGYILLEVMVSGALAAIVLAAAISYMAQAQSQTVRGAKEQTAASLAQQSLERWMILPVGSLVAANFPATENVVIPDGGTFVRRHTIAATPGTISVALSGGLAVTRHQLTVEVEFPLTNGTVHKMTVSTERIE